MALAVTHIILTIVILDFFRHYIFGKKKFPRYLLVIGGIAGLAPDIDIVISWIYNWFTTTPVNFHGTFTHSILWPLLALIIALILQKRNDLKWAKIFYVIAAGLFLHLLLDCAFGGYKSFIWPLMMNNFCPEWGLDNLSVSIDAVILVLWLLHEELHHKIKDYF